MKYTYTVQTHYLGQWRNIVKDTRDFCLGYMQAKAEQAPRNAFRLIRSDGKVLNVLMEDENVNVGQIASWPTPEQYEAAAGRALAIARKIREEKASP